MSLKILILLMEVTVGILVFPLPDILENDLLNLQIKYALRNISEEYSAYSSNSITSPLCDYYLSGINININKNITNSENKNKNNRLSNYNYYNKFNVRK